MDLYLRIAPELTSSGWWWAESRRFFEINRNFRNEGISTRHNRSSPCWSSTRPTRTTNYLMDLTEDLLRQVARRKCSHHRAQLSGETIDLGRRFDRLTMAEAIAKYNPKYLLWNLVSRLTCARRSMLSRSSLPYRRPGMLQLKLFEQTTEDKLVQPTFIVAHPTDVSPLARPTTPTRQSPTLRTVHHAARSRTDSRN